MSTVTAALEKPVPGRKPPAMANQFPVATLQRKCACGGTATSTDGDCQECKKKKLQRRATDFREVNAAPPVVDEVLESPGQPLDAATRSFMEPRFGHDFSKVRVHADHKAGDSARAVNALAYTVGHNVVFGAGQYAPGKPSGRKLLAHELTHVVQQRAARNAAPQAKLEVGPANDSQEQEADRFADQVAGVSEAASAPPPKPPGSSKPHLQRASADQPSATATAPAIAAPAGLIVEDEVQDLATGQMHKSEFLDQLRAEVCATSDAALAPAGRTSKGCPFIEKWIDRLRRRTSQHVERAIRKYAPESAGAKTAKDYIAPVGSRVQRGVEKWAASGEISDVPADLIAEMAGGGVLGFLAGIGSAISSAIGGVTHLFAKARPGGVREGNPAAIQAQLHAGVASRPLDSGVRTRMEAAFGHSFSRVRVHTDSDAAQLSSSLNARAFTVGGDVAFAAGEYQPGTLIGDALIAHELAHVVQQSGGVRPAGSTPTGGASYDSLEEDADVSAVGAVASMWGGAKARAQSIGANVMPALRSGLRLQRCYGCSYAERNALDAPHCCTDDILKELRALRSASQPKVQRARDQLFASPQSVAKQLQEHFKVQPGDGPSIKRIVDHLQLMANAMSAGDSFVRFNCRDARDMACRTKDNLQLLGTSTGCTSDRPKLIQFCGSYDHSPFLGGRNWQQTMIHEYAHAGCPLGGSILPAGSEFYKENPKGDYPGPDAATAINNADSYANFTLDVAAGATPGGPIQMAGFAAMTPWQIAQMPDSMFDPVPSDSKAKQNVTDYKRTRDFARAAFKEKGITFDIDAETKRPVGREPNEEEMKRLKGQLDLILKTPGVQQSVEAPGGRAAPTGGSPNPPSLDGKVRIATTQAEFALKRYQLQMAISEGVNPENKKIKDTLATYWKKYNLQPPARGTDQENRVAAFLDFADNAGVPGFYHPLEDRLYLGPSTDLSRPNDIDTARHETVHYLGGREKTRGVFKARYGKDWLRHWCVFEEGTAELISRRAANKPDVLPPTPENPSEIKFPKPGEKAQVTMAVPYQDEMAFMKYEVIDKLGKDGQDMVFRAFFTGEVPEELLRIMDNSPRTVCGNS